VAIISSEQDNTAPGFGLKRALGLKEVVAIEVGQTIGAGVFALAAIAAAMCGPALPLAFAIAAVPVVFLMLTLAGLSSAIPTTGGTYRYPSRLFSPAWAFLGIWGCALGLVFGMFPLMATTCTHYLQALWPGIPETAFSIGLLTVFFVANIFGIGIAAVAQMAMVGIMFLALLSYGIGGMPHVQSELFHPFLPKGIAGLLAASALLTYAHQGSNAIIELGGEIKDPGRTIPVSLFISIPLVTVIYVLVGYVTVGVAPYVEVAASKDLTRTAAEFMSGGWFAFFVLGGAFLAIATTLNAAFMWATKSMLILAADGLFPRSLARVHPRFKTPWAFLVIIWGLSIFAILAGLPIESFASYAALGGLIIFIPVMISAMLLKKRRPEEYARAPFKLRGALYWIAPAGGLFLTVMTIGMLLYDSYSKRGPWEIILFVLWLVFGYIIYGFLRDRIEREKGMTVREVLAEDDFR